MNMKNIFIALLLYCLLTNIAQSGNLLAKNDRRGCFKELIFNGEIKRGDTEKFNSNLIKFQAERPKENCNSRFNIILSSNGGDVDEALKIGKIIRDNEMVTLVPIGTSCLSSCVFLFSAGVVRAALGRIGIHRPFFVELDDKLSISQVRALREKRGNQLKQFLNEMDVSSEFFDLMMSVNPEDIKILTYEELQKYRLDGVDANYDELQTAKAAKLKNISSAEYRKRDANAKQLCKNKNTYELDYPCYFRELDAK